MELLALQHALLLDANRDVAYARELAVETEVAFVVLHCRLEGTLLWYVRPRERILAALRGAKDDTVLVELLALDERNASPVAQRSTKEPLVPTVILDGDRFVGIRLPWKPAETIQSRSGSVLGRKGSPAEGITATYHDGRWWYLSAHDEAPDATRRRPGPSLPVDDADKAPTVEENEGAADEIKERSSETGSEIESSRRIDTSE